MKKKVFLEPGDYWKWRTAISEMDLAKAKQGRTNIAHKLLAKELEIASYREQLFALQNVPMSSEKVANSKREYDELTKELEEKYKVAIANKVIHDETFEITDLEKEQNHATIKGQGD